MIIFWLVCAIFVAIALAFVLPPLLEGSAPRRMQVARRKLTSLSIAIRFLNSRRILLLGLSVRNSSIRIATRSNVDSSMI